MMSEHDFMVVDMMQVRGGGFVKALGTLFHHADPENFRRLKVAFPEFWESYEKMAFPKKPPEVATSQLCSVCHIGHYLPSGFCDHCDSKKNE